MPKLKQVLNSAKDHVMGEGHKSTLDTCIQALSNNGIQLCKKGEFTPLSEADIRGINPDLGALGTSDLLQQCMDKFDSRGFEKCKVQEVKESVKGMVSEGIDAIKGTLHDTFAPTPAHDEV